MVKLGALDVSKKPKAVGCADEGSALLAIVGLRKSRPIYDTLNLLSNVVRLQS